MLTYPLRGEWLGTVAVFMTARVGILLRVLFKLVLTDPRAEIVGLPLILRFDRCFFFVNGHPAHGISGLFCHGVSPPFRIPFVRVQRSGQLTLPFRFQLLQSHFDHRVQLRP